MKRLALYILSAVMMAVSSYGATVVYRRDRPVIFKRIERLAAKRPVNQTLADSVVSLLGGEGYVDARVEQQGDSLIVDAGSRARLERIVVDGDSTFEVAVGGYFTARTLRESLEAQLERFYDQGYYYAAFEIKSVQRSGPAVTVHADLNRGPLVRVADLRLTGIGRSNPDVIRRLLPVRRGDTLTPAALSTAEAVAEKIDYLTFLPPIRVMPQPGYRTAALEFEFREKKQVRVEGSGGYVPDNSTGLVWSLRFGFTNLFGGGRQATVHSERREKGRNSFELTYRQPLFLIGVDRLGLSVRTRDYRDQFYEFEAESKYATAVGAAWSGGLGLGYKTVSPADRQPSFARYSLAVSVGHTTFAPPSNPASGWGLDWSLTYAHRRYSDDSLSEPDSPVVFNDTRTDLSLAMVRSLRRLAMFFRAGYLGYRTEEPLPPLSELFLIGGPGSLRGYRNEQFAAIHAALFTIEPRLRFEHSYLFLFYDGAYLNNRVRDDNGVVGVQERYRDSFGFGLAVMQPGRRLKLSLGWNPELPVDQPRLSVEFSADL